jgi:hypothetical protein
MSKINEIRKAQVDALEQQCLEEAKKGNKFLLVGVLSDEVDKLLKERGYKINYKTEGVNYSGDTSQLVGTYIKW